MGKCSVENCENKCFDVKQNKCILHCEKNEKNGWYTYDKEKNKVWVPEKIKLFWVNIRNIISDSQQRLSKLLPIPFNHIIFPKFEERGLANIEHYQDSFFEKEGEKKFTQSVKFNNCTFLDYVDFANIQFETDILFSACTLKDEIKFKRQQNIRVSFLNCPEIKSLDFSRIVFEQKVEIKECIINSCNFENTRFKKVCDFYKTHFHSTNFNKTTFEDIAVFTESKFHKDVNFKNTTFEKLALFRKTVFEKTVNFEDSIFKEEANFLDINANMANRETARIIKNSFEQQNNIIEANRFYALEMKEREKELEKEKKNKEKQNLKTFIDYIIFKLHGISSNHSQDPFLALYWIIIFAMTASLYETYLLYTCSFSLINIITINLFLISPIIINKVIEQKFDKYDKYYVGILYFSSYYFITSNCSPINSGNTMSFAKTINPFSIMKGTDDIDIVQLLFKITIAYLIYQFIVSVRQNTRRK